MLNTTKINTNTTKTINETLSIGQRLMNGSNRVFTIETLTPTQVVLKYSDAIETRTSIMNREVFSKLLYMRNYTQIFQSNPLKEWIESTKVGGTRLMIKPAKFQS